MNRSSRKKALFSVLFIAAIDNIGYAMVFVLFPTLLLNPAHGFLPQNPTLISKLIAMGVLYAAFPIAQLIGAPIIGELADQKGRKKIFFLTIIGTIIAYLLTGAFLLFKSIALIFVARFLTGLFSGNQGLCNASIADLSPDEKQRAKNYGLLTVVWGLSFPIALILGGILSDPNISKSFNPSLPFYIVGGVTSLSLVTLSLFFPETFAKAPASKNVHLARGIKNIFEAFRMPKSKPFFTLILIWTLGWGYSVTWYGAYAIKSFGASQVMTTIGFMIQGVGWTLGGSVLKPILLKRLDLWSIAKISFWGTCILLTITSFMPTFFSFVIVYALSAIFGAVSLSSTFNLISLASTEKNQGKAMGIAQSMTSFGFFLVPILGAGSGAISIYTFFPISAFFFALGINLVYCTEKKRH